MMSRYRHVALIGKYPTAGNGSGTPRAALEDISQFLLAQGCDVTFDKDTASHSGIQGHSVLDIAGIGAECDLCVVVGGDGTMLGVGRQLARHDIPLVGINQGRLGFITDIALEGYREALAPILRGVSDEERRSLMHARVLRDGHCVFDALAMNDVVVNRGATSGMVELRVEVDGHFVASQRADGLIVATPTGSTAYALSANGPILHPRLAGIVLVPVAPQSLSNRPITLPDDVRIDIRVVDGREPRVAADMQVFSDLHVGDDIVIERAPFKVHLLHPAGYSHFATLRGKLNWHELPVLSRPAA